MISTHEVLGSDTKLLIKMPLLDMLLQGLHLLMRELRHGELRTLRAWDIVLRQSTCECMRSLCLISGPQKQHL